MTMIEPELLIFEIAKGTEVINIWGIKGASKGTEVINVEKRPSHELKINPPYA